MPETDHESRIARNEADIQGLWKLIEDMRKGYLPLWATFLIAGLASTTTGLIVRVLM